MAASGPPPPYTETPHSTAGGKVWVTIVAGQGLLCTDAIGYPEAYAVVTAGTQQQTTRVVHRESGDGRYDVMGGSLWDWGGEELVFEWEHGPESESIHEITIEIWDEDTGRADDPMGSLVLPLWEGMENTQQWYPVAPPKDNPTLSGTAGELCVRIHCEHVGVDTPVPQGVDSPYPVGSAQPHVVGGRGHPDRRGTDRLPSIRSLPRSMYRPRRRRGRRNQRVLGSLFGQMGATVGMWMDRTSGRF